MNALIARTREEAFVLGKMFRLVRRDTEFNWQFYGYGNMLAGASFYRIVVIPPWDRPFTDQERLWLTERVPLTLKPDGRLVRMGWSET